MHKESLSPSKIFFPNLDGFRTVAFLTVFLVHGFWRCIKYLGDNYTFTENTLRKLYHIGGIGVSAFLVLSGFLITYLLLKESEQKGRFDIVHFYIRRALRIWPLYFAVLIFCFLLYPYLQSVTGHTAHMLYHPAYFFSFLSNFDILQVEKSFPGMNTSPVSITWSIAIEEQFYLIWPLLLYFAPKKIYPVIFISVIILSLVFRFIYINDPVVLYYHSLSACGDLALGSMCAYYAIYSTAFKTFFEKLSRQAIMGIYVTGILWMMYSNGVTNFYFFPVFARLISALFFSFIILEQNYSRSFYKFSKSKALSFWGKYTYGLYLLHPIALLICDSLLNACHLTYADSFTGALLRGFLGLGISMLISYLSYEYYESYFLKIKERFN
ncbi:MAG: acyltransferase [Chitinophagaceae bacterium]|nr:acyltransferase [Chitinophagaceae bacterium]